MIAAQTRTGSTYQREATANGGYRIIRTDANGVKHLDTTVTPIATLPRDWLAKFNLQLEGEEFSLIL